MTTKLHLLNKKTISTGQKFLWFADITHALKLQKITDELIERELEKIKKRIEIKTHTKIPSIEEIKSQKSFKDRNCTKKKNEVYEDEITYKKQLLTKLQKYSSKPCTLQYIKFFYF